MSKKEINIVGRFIAGDKTTAEEIEKLQDWLSDDSELEKVFREEWEKEDLKETEIEFSSIQSRIREIENAEMQTPVMRKILNKYQKIVTMYYFYLSCAVNLSISICIIK
jgi:hypothetical protein